MTERPDIVPAPTAVLTVAVDAGCPDLAAADHLVHELEMVLAPVDENDLWASTHLATGRVVVVASVPAGRVDGRALLDAVVRHWPDAGAVVATRDRRIAHGPVERVAEAASALLAHRSRRSGRLARFPGQRLVERRLTVAEVVARSAVAEVTGLAGVDVHSDAEVDLTGFVRPVWREGHLVVVVQQSADGLIPFEVRDQIPCCSAH